MNLWLKRWARSATGHQTPNLWECGGEKGQGCREVGANDGAVHTPGAGEASWQGWVTL